MLVVDIDALRTVNVLNFLDDIFLNVVSAFCAKNIARVQRTFCDRVARLDIRAVLYIRLEPCAVRYGVRILRAVVTLDHDVALAVFLDDLDFAFVLGKHRNAFRVTCFEKLLYARQTARNIVRRSDAAHVEGTESELSTRLAYTLRGDDTDRFAYSDRRRRRHISAVALGADAVLALTREYRSDLDMRNAAVHDALCGILCDHLVDVDEHLFGLGIDDALRAVSARESVLELFYHLIAVHDGIRVDTFRRAVRTAVLLANNDVLRNVNEPSRKITGVRRL